MQVLIPFTSEVDSGLSIIETANIDFPVLKKETTEYKNVFDCKNNKYDRTLEIGAKVNDKKTEISPITRGIFYIPAIKGDFTIKCGTFDVQSNRRDVNISLQSAVIHKSNFVNLNSGITKTIQRTGMGNLKVDVVRITKAEEQFKCYNGIGSAMNVNVARHNLTADIETIINKNQTNALFDTSITKHNITLESEISKGIGYIVDNEKLNKITLVKGYNLLPIPISLYQNKIYKAYDLLKAIAKQLNQEVYKLFSEISRKQGEQLQMFLVSELWVSNPEGPDNFDLFEINGDSVSGIPVEVYCNQDFTVDMESLNV